MRKKLLTLLVTGVLATAGQAQAALVFDFNGAEAGGESATSNFDWHPASYLSINGNKAVVDYLNDWNGTTNGAPGTGGDNIFYIDNPNAHTFTGYVQSKMNDGRIAAGKEITMVAMFEEQVYGFETFYSQTGVLTGVNALFRTTGVGWFEMYYGDENSDNLSGSGYNDGQLIMHVSGVSGYQAGQSEGEFKSTFGSNVQFDQYGPSGAKNDYGTTESNGQKSISGTGNQSDALYGVGAGGVVQLDSTFFKSYESDFYIQFNATGLGLPMTLVDPADCFTTQSGYLSGVQMGGGNTVTSCANAHTDTTYAAQPDGGGGYNANNGTAGYVPVIGARNGRSNRTLVGSTLTPNPDYGVDDDNDGVDNDGNEQFLEVPLYRFDTTGGGPDFVANLDGSSYVYGTPGGLDGAIPEPGTLALLGLGLAGLGFSISRRRI